MTVRGQEARSGIKTPNWPGASSLMAIGDMHGNLFAWERTVMRHIEIHNPDVIVQVGDMGYGWSADYGHGWDDAYLNRLDELLEEANRDVFWLDGNHENFDRLEQIGAFPNKREPVQTSERTWYLPRGYVWEMAGKRVMAVGGAYSVDKPYRTEGSSWWPQEELTDEDVERAVAQGRVDVMLTHDTYTGFRVPGVHAEWKQDEFAVLCKPNRDKLLTILNSAQPQLYIHGHYHVGYTERDESHALDVMGLDREGQPMYAALVEFPSLETFML